MKVFELISKSDLPVDANYLIDKLKVNKSTVYRQIEKLIEDGKVIEVDFGDGKKRYELRSSHHHHHLVCRKCSTIKDVVLDEKLIIKEFAKRTDFKVESHTLEFFGLCSKCQ